jgi:hypothetical protein
MCSMIAPHAALRDFLARNRKSICSIGFHNVSVFDSSNKSAELKTDMVCEMLEIPQYTVHQGACGICPYSPQRSLLNNDREQSSARKKRKFTVLEETRQDSPALSEF